MPRSPEISRNGLSQKEESQLFTLLDSDIPYQNVPYYMQEHGIKRAFQRSVPVPVSHIWLDEDVVDAQHMPTIRHYDLDNQVEDISVVAMTNTDGKMYFEITNGHHRVTHRKEQAAWRDEPHLTINAIIRYGVSEAEVYQMRLEDLNSKLNGVMFLRISRWLNSAFTLREWGDDLLNHAVDTGQLSTAQAVDLAARPAADTRLKITFLGEEYSLSQAQKAKVVRWVEASTRNIGIGLPQLKN